MEKLFRDVPLVANFARLFKRGSRQRVFLDEPAESQITAGIVCFSGWIAGSNPISALTLEIGDHSEIVSTFHERADVLEATAARHAVGWRVLVHISSPAPGADSIKFRIVVDGVSLLERTLICLGPEQQRVFLDEPTESQITAGIVRIRGLVTGPHPISALTLEIGNRVETISTFYKRTDVIEATGPSHAMGWHLYVHISPRAPGAESLKVRILVGGAPLFERTLICLPRSNGRSAAPLLFCMHIPKTAGTSLRMALDGQPELRALCVYPDDPFISSTRCFELGPAAFDETDVVVGHFAYGFHAISHRPYRYISIVREPFAILSSYYLYAKHVQNKPYISRYSTIYEAAERSEFDNVLTRHFTNRLDGEPIGEDDFSTAKRNIQNDFEYIGTTENMEQSICRIRGIIGVDIPLLHINKTSDTAISETIDPTELRSRLGNKVLFDLRLYEWIVTQFAMRQ
jgi:hypothetical protein